MKEFNKWWKDYSMEGIWDYEDYYRSGWKTALEWVLEECDNCYGEANLSPLYNELNQNEETNTDNS